MAGSEVRVPAIPRHAIQAIEHVPPHDQRRVDRHCRAETLYRGRGVALGDMTQAALQEHLAKIWMMRLKPLQCSKGRIGLLHHAE